MYSTQTILHCSTIQGHGIIYGDIVTNHTFSLASVFDRSACSLGADIGTTCEV